MQQKAINEISISFFPLKRSEPSFPQLLFQQLQFIPSSLVPIHFSSQSSASSALSHRYHADYVISKMHSTVWSNLLWLKLYLSQPSKMYFSCLFSISTQKKGNLFLFFFSFFSVLIVISSSFWFMGFLGVLFWFWFWFLLLKLIGIRIDVGDCLKFLICLSLGLFSFCIGFSPGGGGTQEFFLDRVLCIKTIMGGARISPSGFPFFGNFVEIVYVALMSSDLIWDDI